jgi:hypothetical protein
LTVFPVLERLNWYWLSSRQEQKLQVCWQRDLTWPLPQYLPMRVSGLLSVSHWQLARLPLSRRKKKEESSLQGGVTVGGGMVGEAVGKQAGL